MKKGTRIQTHSLGDIIAALFDETKEFTSDPLEQNILVYAALKDLLKRRRKAHPMARTA